MNKMRRFLVPVQIDYHYTVPVDAEDETDAAEQVDKMSPEDIEEAAGFEADKKIIENVESGYEA